MSTEMRRRGLLRWGRFANHMITKPLFIGILGEEDQDLQEGRFLAAI